MGGQNLLCILPVQSTTELAELVGSIIINHHKEMVKDFPANRMDARFPHWQNNRNLDGFTKGSLGLNLFPEEMTHLLSYTLPIELRKYLMDKLEFSGLMNRVNRYESMEFRNKAFTFEHQAHEIANQQRGVPCMRYKVLWTGSY